MVAETKIMTKGINGAAKPKEEEVVRFNVGQRVEHVVLMVSFIVLMVTGIPQHFADAGWARWLIVSIGGIEMARLVHRFFALIMVLQVIYHFGYVVFVVFARRAQASMLPTYEDARDAMTTIHYSFGMTDEKPKYGRFSYRQKFEYWGVVFGNVIMIATGFLLAFPTFFTRFLPGELIPAAKQMHGWEALLALSIIVIWHLYGTHLAPGKFPFDRSIFTGKISKHELREEHGREYEQMFGVDVKNDGKEKSKA